MEISENNLFFSFYMEIAYNIIRILNLESLLSFSLKCHIIYGRSGNYSNGAASLSHNQIDA